MFKSKSISIFIVVSGLTAASSAFAECPKDANGKEVCPKPSLLTQAQDAYAKSGLEVSGGMALMPNHKSIRGTSLEVKEWRNNLNIGAGYTHTGSLIGGKYVEAGGRIGDKASHRFMDTELRVGTTKLVREGSEGASQELLTKAEYKLGRGFTAYSTANVGRLSSSRATPEGDQMGFESPDLGFKASGTMREVNLAIGKNFPGMAVKGFFPELKAGWKTKSYNLNGKQDITGDPMAISYSKSGPSIGISLHRKSSSAGGAQ
jgi:hypothetical protein